MIFKWFEKIFYVSDSEILTYSGMSASHSYNTEEKKNGKKMPKTKDVGPGIGTMNFSMKLSVLKGNDVKAEHDWWVAECEKGSYSYIYMGSTKFGKYKWRIKQVDISDLVTINDGTLWKSCTLSVSFEEYYVKAKMTKAEKRAAKLQKKLRKQIEKAENAKNEAARTKALSKVETLATQYVEAKVKAAEAAADAAKIIAQVHARVEQILYPTRSYVDEGGYRTA